LRILQEHEVEQWQQVYQARHSMEAGLVQGLLQQQAILVRFSGLYLAGAAGELPLTDTGVRLLVPAVQYAAAEQCIEQYIKQLKQEPGLWYCHCGEANYLSFEICWACGREQNETESQ
jgi:hypothetical protein